MRKLRVSLPPALPMLRLTRRRRRRCRYSVFAWTLGHTWHPALFSFHVDSYCSTRQPITTLFLCDSLPRFSSQSSSLMPSTTNGVFARDFFFHHLCPNWFVLLECNWVLLSIDISGLFSVLFIFSYTGSLINGNSLKTVP